jgi:O-antigen/teichoic acid export membrane protein
VPIFRALGPAAFIGTFNVATGWVYVSLGTTRRQFQWGIFAGVVTILGYAIGLPWGPMGVAVAFSASVVVLRLPSIVYCFRRSPLRLTDLGVALWRPAASSLVAAAALVGLRAIIDFSVSVGVSLALDFIVYAALYIVVWIGLPGGKRSFAEVKGIMRELRLSRERSEDARVHDAGIT